MVSVIVGDATETMPRLQREGKGPFDLIFIDADKANIPAYFGWALDLSRAGSIIIVDNVVRDGEVIDASSTDASVMGVRKFLSALASMPNVTATAIQTTGIKGYDGFAIVRVDELRPRSS